MAKVANPDVKRIRVKNKQTGVIREYTPHFWEMLKAQASDVWVEVRATVPDEAEKKAAEAKAKAEKDEAEKKAAG